MGLFKRIAKAVFNEVSRPESNVKGDEFESYTRDYIFPDKYYKLIKKTAQYDYLEENQESNKEPDFKFQDRKTGKIFYVESKFTSYYTDKGIEWCKPYLLKRYKSFHKKHPVIICIGLGEYSDDPDELFIVPMEKAKYCELFWSILKPCKHKREAPFFISKLKLQ